jgi:murein DD-endopeptidase MepM/ murein hydrolase activator NlpD
MKGFSAIASTHVNPEKQHSDGFFIKHISLLIVSIIMLISAGCTTTPKRQTRPPLPAAELQKLRAQPMPTDLPIPVSGINKYQLKDTWGAARSRGRSHEGIDIMAKRGTKVLSATDGIVADMRNNNLGGKVIWIVGPAGSYHYYAHLDKHKRGLDVGDVVDEGDVIGYVGNTGNARGGSPHLHYGIYLSGKGRGAVNPYPYLIGH